MDDRTQDEELVTRDAAHKVMKVALLGATGFVGSALLDELLRRGHTVSAIARQPNTLVARERLLPVVGDVYDAVGLAELLRGRDALISAFNPGWKDPQLYDDQVRGTASILKRDARRRERHVPGRSVSALENREVVVRL